MTKPFHFQWKASAAEEGVGAGGAAVFSRVISTVRMMWCTGGPRHRAGPPQLDRTGHNLEAGVILKVPLTPHHRPGTDGPSHVNTTTHMCGLREHFNGLKPRRSPRSIVVAPPPVSPCAVGTLVRPPGLVSKQTLATRC